ncbi:MAG: hypothetical protein R6U32_04010 [Candidatus Woesearchaeota archaeon]
MALKTKEVRVQSLQSELHEKLSEMDTKIRNSFRTVKEEFEDHLDAINENTQEIQGQYESLAEINRKIDKLSERVDNVSAMVGEIMSERSSISLSPDEQRVFLLLYMHEEGFLAFEDILARTHFDNDYCRDLISSMLDKGIKLVREVDDGKLYLKLNPYFKARQVRENIVKIDQSVVQQMENKVLGSYF